jgi:hypothetical protein
MSNCPHSLPTTQTRLPVAADLFEAGCGRNSSMRPIPRLFDEFERQGGSTFAWYCCPGNAYGVRLRTMVEFAECPGGVDEVGRKRPSDRMPRDNSAVKHSPSSGFRTSRRTSRSEAP